MKIINYPNKLTGERLLEIEALYRVERNTLIDQSYAERKPIDDFNFNIVETQDLSTVKAEYWERQGTRHPAHPHQLTKSQYEQYVYSQFSHASCTFNDRIRNHRQIVFNALQKNLPVYKGVLVDYPDILTDVKDRMYADIQWGLHAKLCQLDTIYFQATNSKEEFADKIYEECSNYRYREIKNDYSTTARGYVEFQVDGNDYHAKKFITSCKMGHFGEIRKASNSWSIQRGTYYHGSINSLLSINHEDVLSRQQTNIRVSVCA